MRTWLPALGLALCCAVPLQAQDSQSQKPPQIALFETSADDEALRELALALQPVLVSELDQSSRVRVAANPAIDLPSVQLAVDCVRESEECMRLVVEQAGVEGLIAATLRSAGDSVVLTLVYFQSGAGDGLRHVTRKQDGADRDQRLIDATPEMLRELLGDSPPVQDSLPPSESPSHTQPSPTASPDASAEPRAAPLPIGPIVLGAGGLAMLAVGTGFGVAAKGSEDDYARVPVLGGEERDAEAAQELLEQAESQALLANIFLGLGAGAAIGAVVWWLLSPTEDAGEQASLVPVVNQREVGLVLRGTFGRRM